MATYQGPLTSLTGLPSTVYDPVTGTSFSPTLTAPTMPAGARPDPNVGAKLTPDQAAARSQEIISQGGGAGTASAIGSGTPGGTTYAPWADTSGASDAPGTIGTNANPVAAGPGLDALGNPCSALQNLLGLGGCGNASKVDANGKAIGSSSLSTGGLGSLGTNILCVALGVVMVAVGLIGGVLGQHPAAVVASPVRRVVRRATA